MAADAATPPPATSPTASATSPPGSTTASNQSPPGSWSCAAGRYRAAICARGSTGSPAGSSACCNPVIMSRVASQPDFLPAPVTAPAASSLGSVLSRPATRFITVNTTRRSVLTGYLLEPPPGFTKASRPG